MMEPNEILNIISNEYKVILGNKLTGIYVHGSLAFGCFNYKKSDIDFIVVVNEIPTIEEKEALIKTLLSLSDNSPIKGYEMSVVLETFCKNFVYPTPFELHYSIAHLQSCKNNLREYCKSMNGSDKDLAAHFTVIKIVGYTISGKAISEVFGTISKDEYFDSIKSDIENAAEYIQNNPVYVILNLCRVLAYKNKGLILSKEQGGLWGIKNLPKQYIPLINTALKDYKSEIDGTFDLEHSLNFCNYMLKAIFSNLNI